LPTAPPPPARPLAPWWARLVIGAAAGTVLAQVPERFSQLPLSQLSWIWLALMVAGALGLAAIAELGKPRFRPRILLGVAIGAGPALAFAGFFDRDIGLGFAPLFMLAAYVLADAPPVAAGAGESAVSRGRGRDALAGVALIAALLFSCLGTAAASAAYREAARELRVEVAGALFGAGASFALEVASSLAWLASGRRGA
jgi:hypothetical protein